MISYRNGRGVEHKVQISTRCGAHLMYRRRAVLALDHLRLALRRLRLLLRWLWLHLWLQLTRMLTRGARCRLLGDCAALAASFVAFFTSSSARRPPIAARLSALIVQTLVSHTPLELLSSFIGPSSGRINGLLAWNAALGNETGQKVGHEGEKRR